MYNYDNYKKSIKISDSIPMYNYDNYKKSIKNIRLDTNVQLR